MSAPRAITAAQARRIALAAQGFGRARPQPRVTMRDVQATIDRLALFQIDSINVVTRAHGMPLYSRLGPYDPQLLRRAASTRPRRLFEYWGHEASFVDVRLQPSLRWRMQRAAEDAWGSMRRIAREQPGLVDFVLAEVDQRGPITARQIQHDEIRVRDDWGWNWSSVKTCLEWLFYAGEISAAGRNAQFERLYDLPGRVLGPIADEPTPSEADAYRTLVARSARALGVASRNCLADYFRLRGPLVQAAIDDLVAAGQLVPVSVRGWNRATWVWHEARFPRRMEVRALVSPFDSLVFERRRLAELFGCDYRIEIYVPEAKRRYGYYVYLLVLGDRIAARVDLKADRARGALVVKSAWREPDAPGHVAVELAAELRLLAGWQGLDAVEVAPVGDLAAALAQVV